MVDQTEVQLILVEHSPGFDITNNFSQPTTLQYLNEAL